MNCVLLLLWLLSVAVRAQVLAGPATMPMPALAGLPVSEAVQRLTRLGLSAQCLRTPSGQDQRIVLQSPAAGTRVEGRTRILLYVGDRSLQVAPADAVLQVASKPPAPAGGGWGLFWLGQAVIAFTLWKVAWPMWKRRR